MKSTRNKAVALTLNALLCVLSIAACLVVLHFVFNIRYGKPGLNRHASHNRIFTEYDPLLGWKLKPDYEGTHATAEYSVREKTNSRGIRGHEYPYRKREGEYRILVLGDSFTEGYSVDFEELFTERLKALLNADAGDGQAYQVINMGVAGYSTDQELLLFRAEGRKYKPDLTILMFHDNDVWYNNQERYWRGFKPKFTMDLDRITMPVNIPHPHPDKAEATGAPSSPSMLSSMKSYLRRESSFYCFVRDRIHDSPLFYQLGVTLGLVKPIDKDAFMLVPEEFGVYSTDPTEAVGEAWQITDALLAAFDADAASLGSSLLVFHVPSIVSVDPAAWETVSKRYRLDENWSGSAIENRLLEACNRHGIPFFASIDELRAEEAGDGNFRLPTYFQEDRHWTAAGHRVAARILKKAVQNHQMKEAR